VFRDLGMVDHSEPFTHLLTQGMVLMDGAVMSKSRGNVVDPDAMMQKYGADAFRCFLMFIGPWEDGGPFNLEGISGIERWLNRVWALVLGETTAFGDPGEDATREMRHLTHKTLRRVTADYEGFRWNTAIAALMEMANGLSRAREAGPVDQAAWEEATEKLMLMIAPLTPHLAEELWERTGHEFSVHLQRWPAYDEGLASEDAITLVVQVNGKVRDRITVAADITKDDAKRIALESEAVTRQLAGGEPRKVIYVPGKLVNIVA